jgi:hypothetical protein
LSFCERLPKRSQDIGDEIVNRERARQQALRAGDRDGDLEAAADRLEPQRAIGSIASPARLQLSRKAPNSSRIRLRVVSQRLADHDDVVTAA